MGPIDRAITELRFRIPPRVLDAVFVRKQVRWRAVPQSFEQSVLEAVVRPRVLVDCNLVGGTHATISLEGLACDTIDIGTYVYRIPKDRTQGRSIVSVLNLSFASPMNPLAYGGVQYGNISTALTAGQAVMDVHAAAPYTSTARCSLIGENVVLIRDAAQPTALSCLRVILGNDENLSHIKMRSYRHFSKLVELAVKSYIYNEYILEMDMAELVGGQALGRFKEVIDGYADSEELYQEYINTTWTKVAFMNDDESYGRFINTIIGGYR